MRGGTMMATGPCVCDNWTWTSANGGTLAVHGTQYSVTRKPDWRNSTPTA